MQVVQGSDAALTRLIVNADDYGYFRCVSDGILATVDGGVVTAVGIMATGPNFESLIGPLRDRPSVDVGVHLDLSLGTPITTEMRRTVARSGRFAGRYAIAFDILRSRVNLKTLRAEWQAQIERVQSQGTSVRFLNSHEHLHLQPPLSRLIDDLAEANSIPFVRRVLPEWRYAVNAKSLMRSLVAGLSSQWLDVSTGKRSIPCLGLGQSGRIDMNYLRRRLTTLPYGTFELMCHPGRDNADEIHDPALRRYHAWEQELGTLLSDEFRELRRQLDISLVRYRDLIEPSTSTRERT